MERQLKKQNEPDQEHQKERSEAEKKEFEKKGKEEIEQLQSRWEHARAEIECSFEEEEMFWNEVATAEEEHRIKLQRVQEESFVEELLRAEEEEEKYLLEELEECLKVEEEQYYQALAEEYIEVEQERQLELEQSVIIQSLRAENEELKKKNKELAFGVHKIEENDDATKFYTGLPAWRVFLHLYHFLSPYIVSSSTTALSPENGLLLVLVRLRLALLMEDLASLFNVSPSVASRTFQKYLQVMYCRLRFLIACPSREVMNQNMPMIFKQLYPNCRCTIDCSEIFIETPTYFEARNKTYSNYKKHNTVKFLIGVSPCGAISFLSHCWGGRVSDKNLTQESNFYKLLEPGDIILADHGLTITDDIAMHGAVLKIPAFTRGKSQLSQRDVEVSKELSRVRIHIERVIGLLKNKYTLLKGPLPFNILKHKGDVGLANIDKILVVCAALTSMCSSVV